MIEHPPFYTLEDLPPLPRLALAVGVFDGVHIGHQALLRHAREFAGDSGVGRWPVAAMTFNPHPAVLFAPDAAPPLLGTLEERVALLRTVGADIVIVARFDREFAALSPEAFVDKILVNKLRIGAVVTGDDFRYGHNRDGNPGTLHEAGVHFGFQTSTLPPVLVGGVPARSTNIRNALREGDVALSTSLLGRPYTLSGTVVRGQQLGRTIGFPTANLDSVPNVLVPAAGVYAGRALIAGETHRAAISVGDNPTVAPAGVTLPRTVEAFLLDGFNRDIYGESLVLQFAAHLRPMIKYDGLAPLVEQMNRDVAETMRLLPLGAASS